MAAVRLECGVRLGVQYSFNKERILDKNPAGPAQASGSARIGGRVRRRAVEENFRLQTVFLRSPAADSRRSRLSRATCITSASPRPDERVCQM